MEDDENLFTIPGYVEQPSLTFTKSSSSGMSSSGRRSLDSCSSWAHGRNGVQWSAHGLSVLPESSPELEVCTSSHTYLLDKERSIRLALDIRPRVAGDSVLGPEVLAIPGTEAWLRSPDRPPGGGSSSSSTGRPAASVAYGRSGSLNAGLTPKYKG